MTDIKPILRVLRDTLKLYTRHCRLLEAQEQALLLCNRERFTSLQTEHAHLLIDLEAQESVRRAAMTGEDGEPLTLSALKMAASTGQQRELETLEENLRSALDRISLLSCRNKLMIQNELEYFAFTLDLFVEAGRSADSGYGPGAGGGVRPPARLLLDRRA